MKIVREYRRDGPNQTQGHGGQKGGEWPIINDHLPGLVTMVVYWLLPWQPKGVHHHQNIWVNLLAGSADYELSVYRKCVCNLE